MLKQGDLTVMEQKSVILIRAFYYYYLIDMSFAPPLRCRNIKDALANFSEKEKAFSIREAFIIGSLSQTFSPPLFASHASASSQVPLAWHLRSNASRRLSSPL